MSIPENMISKSEVSDEIWGRVKVILETRGISQINLEKLCAEQGFRVTQPEISRLNSGNSQLTLYQLIGVSKALKIPVEQLINPQALAVDFQSAGGAFITDPDHAEFEGYKGKFYTVFHSTNSYSEKFLYGELNFGKDNISHICRADFELNTGELDSKKKPISKRYGGQLLISGRMGVGYCILYNERMGEICNLAFRHRAFFVKEVQCRLGLVLTVSAGEVKRPAVHRIFLSRYPISEDILSKISPILKLDSNHNEVLVSCRVLKELEKECIYPNFDFNALIEKSFMEDYVLVDEASIRAVNRRLSNYEVREILSSIKDGCGSFTSYLNEADDSYTYDILQRFDRKDME